MKIARPVLIVLGFALICLIIPTYVVFYIAAPPNSILWHIYIWIAPTLMGITGVSLFFRPNLARCSSFILGLIAFLLPIEFAIHTILTFAGYKAGKGVPILTALGQGVVYQLKHLPSELFFIFILPGIAFMIPGLMQLHRGSNQSLNRTLPCRPSAGEPGNAG